MKVFNVVHSLIPDGDIIKDQAVHQAVLHAPEDLLLAHDAGGGHGDVLEGQTVDISGFSLLLLRITPGLNSCSGGLAEY